MKGGTLLLNINLKGENLMKRLKILVTTILLSMILVSCSETDKQSFAGDKTEANELVSKEVSETEATKEEPTKEEPTKEEPTKEEPTKEEPTKEEATKEELQSKEVQTEEAQTEELEETQEVESKNLKKYKKTNDVKYAKSDVNIRKGPTSKHDKLGVLAKGQKVNRIGVTDNGWAVIDYKGNEAYVSGRYLQDTKPEKQVTKKLVETEKAKETEASKEIKEAKIETKPEKEKKTTEKVDTFSPNKYADEVLRLVNIERSKAGLPAFTTAPALREAANIRAKEIETLFDHKRPDGSQCYTALKECDVSYSAAGENIASGHTSPEHVVNGWMNSPGHKENILGDSFGKMGVGVHKTEDGSLTWVQLFTN